MKIAFASMLLLAACGRGAEPANQVTPGPAPKGAPQVVTAEQLVRARIGERGPARFVEAHNYLNRGAAIVCGAYEQAGARHRYIVVGGEDVFVEPDTPATDMAQAFREFCGDGERG